MSQTAGESGALSPPAIVVHGGAGTFERAKTPETVAELEEGIRRALAAGWRVLADGGGALDAVVEAVVSLEDGGRFNAGRGAVPNSEGAIELDASVMSGRPGVAGAVAATTWPANPVRVARAVAEHGGAPDGPVLLAGPGADDFAREHGFPPMASPPSTDGPVAAVRGLPPQAHGTVGAVAVDATGRLAAATSTGGRSGQAPGRVGDSPVPGAGVWAADDSVAVSATGMGEAFLLAGFAHRVDWQIRAGLRLDAALDEALTAVAALGATGGGIALAPTGAFAARFTTPAMARGWQDSGGASAQIL